ncbi:MAG: polysaccharide biosynthesis/export family protein [Sphingomicrobium sp.]
MRCAVCAILLAFAAVPAAAAAQVNASASAPMLVPAVDPSALRATAPIGPLDRLEVIVFREPELSVADTPVDESGRIMLPLAGEFSAAGKSAQSLATEISQRLRQYLRNPEVAVRVKQAASKRITVAGSVMQPGVFPVEGRVTLLQAVALARGPSQVADLDTTLIFRTQNGQKTVAKFDIGAISRGKAPDPEVLPGDTIAVGSSGLKTAWRDITMGLRSFNIFRIIP